MVALAFLAGGAVALEPRDPTRVIIPDDKEEALKTLKAWLDSRGIECDARKGLIVMRRGGVLMNLVPMVHKGELDRIRVEVYYNPKDEFKKSKEMQDLATKLNAAQNFFQVFIDESDGDLGVAANLTFVDELTAKLFDAFVDAAAQIVKLHILTPEALKLLK